MLFRRKMTSHEYETNKGSKSKSGKRNFPEKSCENTYLFASTNLKFNSY
jgi:hypothetical protein